MAAREYTLKDGKLYNGAVDTGGGIWVRIDSEADRRIGTAAIAKQQKNQDAAKGTLVALDPNASHLVDYVGESLKRILDGFNGARPASAQLDGTPMGEAIKGDAKGGKKGAKGDGKAAAAVDTVKRADASSTGKTGSDGITWSDDAPKPRPSVGQNVTWSSDGKTGIKSVLGYRSEQDAFEVVDSDDWHGFIESHDGNNGATVEWRVKGASYKTPRIPFNTLDSLIADAPAVSDDVVESPSGAVQGGGTTSSVSKATGARKTPIKGSSRIAHKPANKITPAPKPGATKKKR